MKFCVFAIALLCASVYCDLAPKVEVYAEQLPFDKLPASYEQKISLKDGIDFAIVLPSTWYYPPGKWIIYKISDPSVIKCAIEEPQCPNTINNGPMFKAEAQPVAANTAKSASLSPDSKILPANYGPIEEFRCKAIAGGKSTITFYFLMLGAVKPCLKYKVDIKVSPAKY